MDDGIGRGNWLSLYLNERQQKEIKFSKIYASQFAHGTDGHNGRLIVAKLARLIEAIDEQAPDIVCAAVVCLNE